MTNLIQTTALALAAFMTATSASAQRYEAPQDNRCASLINRIPPQKYYPKTGVGFVQEGSLICKTVMGPDEKTRLPASGPYNVENPVEVQKYIRDDQKAARDEATAVRAEKRENFSRGEDRAGRRRGNHSVPQ